MDIQTPKTKNQKPKTAVIGVGSLGQHHARNFAELSRTGKGEFVGVCDVNEENARKIAEKNSCEYFTDWRELLDKTDAVSIVTPTETHSEIACEFLEKGVNVLVEKPFARSLEEADKMIASAQKTGAKLMVGHLERYNPAMVALRPHVTNPLYFEIHRVSPFPNRSLDVDVVLDVMIHDLDAINWLVGENINVSEIRAVGIPVISSKVDAANARIEFENGAVANITASRIGTEKIRKTRFYQTNSYVVLDYGTKFASVTSLKPRSRASASRHFDQSPRNRRHRTASRRTFRVSRLRHQRHRAADQRARRTTRFSSGTRSFRKNRNAPQSFECLGKIKHIET